MSYTLSNKKNEDMFNFNIVFKKLKELTENDDDMKKIESNYNYYIKILNGKTANNKKAYDILKKEIDIIKRLYERIEPLTEQLKMSPEDEGMIEIYKEELNDHKKEMIKLIPQNMLSQPNMSSQLSELNISSQNMSNLSSASQKPEKPPRSWKYPNFTRQRSMQHASSTLVKGGRRKRRKTKRNNRRKTKRRN